ncbi:hypothetical protein C2S52_009144 [Perilla frutescens var. hirtella]|nr:hypothetical protein C2S52_009144 [Perilla frutescens var. hirtella]
MACMKLGSKSDLFQLEGQSWLCTSGLPSDVCVEVGETSFHLHKFPLLSRCKFPEKCIQEKEDERKSCVWCLDELPGGAGSFLLVAKFCYDVKFEVTATNVVSLRCAAEYLEMTDEHNLVSQTCSFLDHQVLKSWADTIHALETCEAEAVLPLSEELDIVSRCIDSLAAKACEDPSSSWPTQSPSTPAVWNGIHSTSEPCSPSQNWWYDDVAVLSLPLFKRLIHAVTCKGMRPNIIAGSVMFYAKRYLPLNGRSSSSSFSQRNHHESSLSDGEQTALVEEIIQLLPDQKGATPTKFLLKLLKISIILDASSARRETLERRIGAQLDEACLQDLLIPNTAPSVETLYDVECVQRIVDHFLDIIHDHDDDDDDYEQGSDDSLPQITVVANLLDAYLAEVASDVNLKLEDFVLLASSFPEYARSLDDGIYRAIDIYLKEHPWLTETERELLCRLMNCQKLSLEASTNAAQNEMLPLRVTMQVLFFEQIRLRSYMAGWFVVAGTTLETNERNTTTTTLNDVRERVCRLEKKCDTMKHDIKKIVKTKGRWINFYKRFGLKVRTKSFDLKSSNAPNCNAH